MSSTGNALNKTQSVLFNAHLRPNRSLSPFGFKVLMVSITGVLCVCGVGVVAIGAWPVLGFFGLDMVLIFFAFRLSYQSGGSYEVVIVTRDELKVTKVNHRGNKQVTRFQPYWLRISLEVQDEDDNALILTSHGKSISLGDCLAPEERCELAQELGRVLKTIKQ